QHFYGVDAHRFALPIVEGSIRGQLPALKLHAVAFDLFESIVRPEIARNIVLLGEISESAACRISSVEIWTVGELLSCQRGLLQQETRSSHTGQLLVGFHLIGNFTSATLRNGVRGPESGTYE